MQRAKHNQSLTLELSSVAFEVHIKSIIRNFSVLCARIKLKEFYIPQTKRLDSIPWEYATMLISP